ncbi:MAG: M23 family metallopeptidase [Balneolaceae bacterium]
MHIKKIVFVLVMVMITCSIQKAQAQAPFVADSISYMWPTDASPYLSSTFAETRSAHLHAGIDIRTWGREGYKVFATRDGVVYRIGISPRGYGKVIYLKHDDGSFSLYAHLNRFEDELQAFADSLRLTDYTFELDEHIEDEGISFQQGDLIGYTGSTGVGPPHLHFELRTPGFEPFNPLLTNLEVEDTLPPEFTHIGIEFLNPKTFHQEGHQIIPVRTENSLVHFGEITVSGPVGLSVNVHDRANRTPNVYAVHSLLMMQESDTLFYSEADYFSYDHSRQMFLDRSYPILAQTRRGFQRMYLVEGNQLPFYQTHANKGVLNFEEGSYPVKIIASDLYGNKQTAWITIHSENSDPAPAITYVPTYPKQREQKIGAEHSFYNFAMYASAGEPVYSETGAKYETGRQKSSIHSVQIIPQKTFSLETPSRDLWIQFPQKALYDTLSLRMEVTEHEKSVDFNFEPNRLPVQGSLLFNYLLPRHLNHNDKLALLSYDQYRDRLIFLNSVNSEGIIRAELKEISDLRLVEDRTAPWIGQPELTKNLAGNYIIQIPAKDDMTKIDYKSSVIMVNGKRGIVEFDPEKNLLIYYHPHFTPKNMNEIKLQVFDGVGNKTERTSSLPWQP